ncbi:MAG: hypothetical protein GC206_14310 [Alphaproteobacteria bacterium]|nr:hypothetical protein [Alphaproteobacteria bacterium]
MPHEAIGFIVLAVGCIVLAVVFHEIRVGRQITGHAFITRREAPILFWYFVTMEAALGAIIATAGVMVLAGKL